MQYNGINLPYLSQDSLDHVTRSRYDLMGRLSGQEITGPQGPALDLRRDP